VSKPDHLFGDDFIWLGYRHSELLTTLPECQVLDVYCLAQIPDLKELVGRLSRCKYQELAD